MHAGSLQELDDTPAVRLDELLAIDDVVRRVRADAAKPDGRRGRTELVDLEPLGQPITTE